MIMPQTNDQVNADLPVLKETALYGLAGQFANVIDPATEADRAAVFAQFLTAFGVLSHTAYYPIAKTKHHCALFTCIVGDTSTAGKGTSWSFIDDLFARVDDDWHTRHCQGGLRSGQMLIKSVWDGNAQQPGEDDKRVLFMQDEFSSILRSMKHQTGTLGETLQSAWAGPAVLWNRSLATDLRATGAHIAMVGHTTAVALRAHLADYHTEDGFANRFIWVYAKRSKILAEPVITTDMDNQLDSIKDCVRDALLFAREQGPVTFNDDARTIWHGPTGASHIGRDRVGVVGAVCGRARPQTLRLALIIALLDHSPMIRAEHLNAAIAFWDYCEASVKYIFADSIHNKKSQKLLDALEAASADGMNRTRIQNEVFKKNLKPGELESILNQLLTANLIHAQPGGYPHGRRFFYGPIPNGCTDNTDTPSVTSVHP